MIVPQILHQCADADELDLLALQAPYARCYAREDERRRERDACDQEGAIAGHWRQESADAVWG